jgi:hypothetical protein
MKYDRFIKVKNRSQSTVEFVLEPWGEVYKMAPNDMFVVAGKGPEEDSFEVVFENDAISVWGWPGSVLWLYHNDKELGERTEPRTPVPPIPRRPK